MDMKPGVSFDPNEAWLTVKSKVVDRLMTDDDRRREKTSIPSH